jgi:membrane protease subunit (stomatin/prohibitin family)
MFNWIKNETKSLYIARPDNAANELIWAHPDRSIPRGAKITVRSDEIALFYREGRLIGRISPGSVLMDTANVPFLGHLLIDQFTGGNQFITELYFCKTSETQVSLHQQNIGQYTDLLSTNLVSLFGGLEYTLVVSDPEQLIQGIGGQNIISSDLAIEKLNGRVNNALRNVVGQLSKVHQITDITSGSLTESITSTLHEKLSNEFSRMGVQLIRPLNLIISLDPQSEVLLREFGKRRSDLRIQEMGAQIATQEGFAEFNLIQGQRQALEGLGDGLATGNSPILMGGLGLAANLTGSTRSRVTRANTSNSTGRGGLIRGERKFFCTFNDQEQGPLSARNLALLALSKNVALKDLMIRSEDDDPSNLYAAEYEPSIRDEYNRRKPS